VSLSVERVSTVTVVTIERGEEKEKSQRSFVRSFVGPTII
jgi:hypothetical protein